jgi:hypothetical protein
MLAHCLHNASVVIVSRSEPLRRLLRIEDLGEAGLPIHVWLPACVCIGLAVILLIGDRASAPDRSSETRP